MRLLRDGPCTVVKNNAAWSLYSNSTYGLTDREDCEWPITEEICESLLSSLEDMDVDI